MPSGEALRVVSLPSQLLTGMMFTNSVGPPISQRRVDLRISRVTGERASTFCESLPFPNLPWAQVSGLAMRDPEMSRLVRMPRGDRADDTSGQADA